jgi:hypothetical protein
MSVRVYNATGRAASRAAIPLAKGQRAWKASIILCKMTVSIIDE